MDATSSGQAKVTMKSGTVRSRNDVFPWIGKRSGSWRCFEAWLYVRWNELTAAGDAGGLIRMLHDDFSYTDAKGHVERRPAFDNRLRESFQRSRNLSNSATILKVEGLRNRATAWTIYGVKMEYQQGAAWVEVEYKLKTQDTFVRKRGSWVLLTSKVLPD